MVRRPVLLTVPIMLEAIAHSVLFGEVTMFGASVDRMEERLRELGDHYTEQTLRARADGKRRDEAIASYNLGRVHEQLGDLPEAIACISTCAAIERALGDPEAERSAAHAARLRARCS